MTRMQLLFDSLHSQLAHQPNDRMAATIWKIDPTTPTDTTKAAHQSTKPCTLGEYLTMLSTPTCFVPFCMINCTGSPQPPVTCLSPCPTAQTILACRCGENQHQFTAPECSDLPCIRNSSVTPRLSIVTVSLSHLLLTHVLPAQLNCPLDHNPTHCPIGTPPHSTLPTQCPTCNDAQFTKA